EYHESTKHSLASVQSDRHGLDWANQPLPFKIYTSLEAQALELRFSASRLDALSAIADSVEISSAAIDLAALTRLCYFSNGVTKVLRDMPSRAAACTGALYHIEEYLI